MYKKLTIKHWRSNIRLMQVVVELIRLLEKPDDSKNYFNHIVDNDDVWEQYISDRATYFSIARTLTEQLNNVELPWRDGGDPMRSINLQFYEEQAALADGFEFLNLNNGQKRENDDEITRRKEAQQQKEKERQQQKQSE